VITSTGAGEQEKGCRVTGTNPVDLVHDGSELEGAIARENSRLADRTKRLAVVTGAVLVYISVGIALGLNPTAYLLLGVPITAAFQVLVARRPIRSLWLLDARPFRLDPAGWILASFLAAVAAITIVLPGIGADPWVLAYGLLAVVGAIPAAFALRAMDAKAGRALIRSLITVLPVGGGLFVLAAFASRGLGAVADPMGMLRIGVVSFLQYIPLVFVVEEVLFRGALDSYARTSKPDGDWTSAFVVSALWGAWHLPLTFAVSGFAQLPAYLVFHTVQGLLYTRPWRRSGNLAVPGITHAAVDAVRNAFLAV
jgi:membrane protease YdiL (CAAX protease family)